MFFLSDHVLPSSNMIFYITICAQSGKACLGDSIYRYTCSADTFSPDHLLDCLNITSEHEALDLADRVEASMYTWRRKACLSHSKSSWDLVKDLMAESDWSDKNHVLAERADSLLFCLKQRYPELSQTTLDTSKIQCNMVSLCPSIKFIWITANHVIICMLHESWNWQYLKTLWGNYFLQDVGKAILESYSRVLEGLAFNTVAWIEDVLFVDRTMRNEQ